MRQQMATTERTEIEQELLEVGKLKPKTYPNRQDELADILRAIEKVPNKEFDTISDGAANWYNAAADAMNEHEDLPDFDQFEGSADEDDEETSDDHDHEADEAEADTDDEDDDDNSESEDPEGDEDNDDDDDEVNEGSVEEDEADEAPPPKTKKRVSKESEDIAAEAEAKTKKKAKKAATKQVADEYTLERDPQDDDEDEKPKKPKKPAVAKTPYDRLSGAKDKFGLYDGTQASKAAHLYEQGATVKHVSSVLGGKHRNVLTRLAEFGHRVEKLEGGVYKVTHKDNLNAPAKKSKKK
jgi:hypothetical protein